MPKTRGHSALDTPAAHTGVVGPHSTGRFDSESGPAVVCL